MIVIFIVYGGYLWFQLYSHTSLYNDDGDDIAKSTIYSPRTHHFRPHKNKDVESAASTSMLTGVITEANETKEKPEVETPEAELETPQMTVWVTMGLLAVVTAVSYLLYTLVFSH